MAEPVLAARGVVAGYQSGVDILCGLDLVVAAGEIVAVVGPNGAGKSTLIKCLCGLLSPREGQVTLDGEDITRSEPWLVARRGVGYVPQRENVFPRMTVDENLALGGIPFAGIDVAAAKARAFEVFPQLVKRRRQVAGILSGGERQMLAMARANMCDPRVLLLDEPSAGVDPGTVEILWEKIEELHAGGVTILMVEQNARQALAMSDRGYVLDTGQTRFEGTGHELLADSRVAELYLGGRPATDPVPAREAT